MKFSASVLCLVGLASKATAETCSGFESRLTALSAQVQAMIDIVEAMQPNPDPPCGGIVGAKISNANNLGKFYTASTNGSVDPMVPDYSAYTLDTEWCCNLCRTYSDTSDVCVYWELRYGDSSNANWQYCQLFSEYTDAEKLTTTADGSWSPGFITSLNSGINTGTRTAGRVPESGMWGTASGNGKDTYMVDTMGNGDTTAGKTYEWAGNAHAMALGHSDPGDGVQAEGYEMCDSLGAFKPDPFNAADAAVENLNFFTRDALECCSLCIRSQNLDGTAMMYPCALWSYSYKSNLRRCYTKNDAFEYATGLPISGLNFQDSADVETWQNSAGLCARYNYGGVAQRYKPDGSECEGGFDPHTWTSGVPHGTDLSTIYV